MECLLPWSWWWYHKCKHMSKLIKYVQFVYINYTSIKLKNRNYLLKWVLSSTQSSWPPPLEIFSLFDFRIAHISGFFLPSWLTSLTFTVSSYTIWPLNVEIYCFYADVLPRWSIFLLWKLRKASFCLSYVLQIFSKFVISFNSVEVF